MANPNNTTRPEPQLKKQTYASVWYVIEKSPEAADMRLRAELMIAVQCHVI